MGADEGFERGARSILLFLFFFLLGLDFGWRTVKSVIELFRQLRWVEDYKSVCWHFVKLCRPGWKIQRLKVFSESLEK